MRATFIEMSLELLGSKTGFYKPERYTSSSNPIMIFDIDYCLYQSSEMCKAETTYISSKLKKLGVDVGSSSWKDYVGSLGSSKLALYSKFGFSLDKISKEYDFQSIEPFLSPNIELKILLKSIRCKKFCFTNGFQVKAERILKRLDLLDCFIAVFCADVKHNDFILKPADKAYEFVEEFLGITSNNRPKIMFFDDSKKNCEMARKFAWTAIHVQAPKKVEDYLREYINDPRVFEDEYDIANGCGPKYEREYAETNANPLMIGA